MRSLQLTCQLSEWHGEIFDWGSRDLRCRECQKNPELRNNVQQINSGIRNINDLLLLSDLPGICG